MKELWREKSVQYFLPSTLMQLHILCRGYLVEVYVFINGESNSSNKEAITSKVGERSLPAS